MAEKPSLQQPPVPPLPPIQPPPPINNPSAHPTQAIPGIQNVPDAPQTELSPSQLNVHVTYQRTPASAAASTTSTLMPSVRAPAPSPATDTTPKRQKTLLYESPSPNKHNPDFEKVLSDDVSVCSGDDSEGWANEEKRMEGFVAEQKLGRRQRCRDATGDASSSR